MGIHYNKPDNTSTAVEYANAYLSGGSPFYKHYSQVDFYPDMSDIKLHEIMFLLNNHLFSNQISVVKWTPKWRWTKAIAMTNDDGKIHLNVHKMNRHTAEIVETIIHETIHIADDGSEFSFGHGSNNPKGKKNTAPYLIGALAYLYFTEGRLLKSEELDGF